MRRAGRAMKRRVVVTGMGIVSPLGLGVERVWDRLIAGQSGLSQVEHIDLSDMPVRIAGCVPPGPREQGCFDVGEWIPIKEQRKMGRFIQYAVAAGVMAVEDAGWTPDAESDLNATGVMIGSGIGGLSEIADTAVLMEQRGPRRVSPFFVPSNLINLASGNLSIRYGFRGPNHAVVTACATGTHAVGDAARMIALGDAEVMVAGGAEAAVCRIGMAGFIAARALCTKFNDTPQQASRPWDKARDGFVMGEGAGVLVLEELEHARKRGARIYGEVLGYGLSGDASHITAPSEDGAGASLAMSAALRSAGLDAADIDYINAHGTSTPLGDMVEVTAVRRTFGRALERVSMSSTKSSIGHLLGAAGAVEAVFTVKALQTGILPPTLNLDDPSEGCEGIDLVPKQARQRRIARAMSNSFGFGGTNATLIFGAAP